MKLKVAAVVVVATETDTIVSRDRWRLGRGSERWL